ncbi:MAG: hypothetical protein CMN21_00735, partial [Rubinisphaera sp.]|nr:hypothetical protein [Rubinisphaera sp.]
ENQFGLVTPSIVETSFNLAIHQRPIIAHGDLGVHQGISSIRDGQRVKGKTTDQTLLIIICLAVSAFVILNRMSNSNMRIELTPQSDRITLGTHPLTIVNTSGEKPFGGTHRTHKDRAAGITTHSFESANGRYKITLVDKVLTVNGERYTLENPTDAIRIVDDRVEITKVTTLPDGERFDSQTLPDNIDVEQIVDRMTKVYAECKSYTDTGVIESVVRETPDSPNMIIDHSFTTAFVRPGRIRFEIENEDKEKLLISANESNIQTWWDLEPGIRKPASLDLAFAEGLGFAGGNVGHIPALLMPQKLEVWEASLKVVEPKRIYERKLENVECYCLEFKFDEQRTVLWIDKQSYLILQIEQSIKTEDNYYEWRTTFNPTINDNVTEQMLEFDPPSPRSADDSANTIPEEELKQLQGDWESVSVTEGGKQLATENGFGGLLLQIKGNTFVITERKPNGEKSEVDTGRIEIDITTSPKTIDFIGRDERRLGIYELKDDLLRLCLIERSGTDAPEEKRVPGSKTLKRPKTFDSPTGSNIMLMEFRRKQTEPSSQAQGGLLNDVIDDDQPLLQGTWRVVFVEDSGRTGTPQMPDGQQVEIEFIFADNKLTTVMPDRTSVATFQLNPSTSPKSIDVTENGRTKPGIYDIEGDSLRVCFSEFTDERPTSR